MSKIKLTFKEYFKYRFTYEDSEGYHYYIGGSDVYGFL